MKSFTSILLLFVSFTLFSQENDNHLVAKRELALHDWDFQLADYYFGKISKKTKDSLNLKRKWISNINFQPRVTSVSNWELAFPFGGLERGFGLNPTSQWQIQQQWNNNGINVNRVTGQQKNYKIQNSFRLDEKWELKLNYIGTKITGDQSFYDEYYGVGAPIDEPIENLEPNSQQVQFGSLKRGIHSTSIGAVKHGNYFKTGGFLGIRNEYLTDSLTVLETDSTPEINLTSSKQINYHQLSIFGQWSPQHFNNGLKITAWTDIPFDGQIIGFSPYLRTEILLTPNTWIGGWIRHYSKALEPVELAADVQNFGLDRVYLKYGGFISYQKSARWWIDFNIELQKRQAYKSTLKYSTLSLDFKFTYRLLQKDKKEK